VLRWPVDDVDVTHLWVRSPDFGHHKYRLMSLGRGVQIFARQTGVDRTPLTGSSIDMPLLLDSSVVREACRPQT
jgi:hypothetical protein